MDERPSLKQTDWNSSLAISQRVQHLLWLAMDARNRCDYRTLYRTLQQLTLEVEPLCKTDEKESMHTGLTACRKLLSILSVPGAPKGLSYKQEDTFSALESLIRGLMQVKGMYFSDAKKPWDFE